MINTSEEYKQAIFENRKLLVKARCLLKNGTLLNFDNSNIMNGGVGINDSVSSSGNFDIGAAIVNQLTMKINNIDEAYSGYDFTDAQFTVWEGVQLSNGPEWLKKGVFNATDPTEPPSLLTIKALDNMSKFDKVYDGNMVFPITVQSAVQYCCDRCGVLLETKEIPNKAYVIVNNPFKENSNVTYRTILSYSAMIAGCWARCNGDGNLELKWYDTAAFVEGGKHHDINKLASTPSASAVDVVITGIKVTTDGNGSQNVETYLAGTEGYVLNIAGNPLIQYGQAKTVASFLAERIVGMRFRPIKVSTVGDPSWEAGDAAVITDRRGRKYNCYLTNINYTVGRHANISCEAQPAKRKSADRYKEINKIIAEIKNNTREQLSEYGEYFNQMNSLAINAMGYYETVELQDNGSKITYMHDKPILAESNIVYKKSVDGYFWSNDGGKTWNGGIDKNGNAVMNVIATIGLHAEWITSGRIQVSDNKGNIIFLVDMDTKRVIISGDSVRIGGKTASEAIQEALNAAAAAKNMTMQLSDDYVSIPVDSFGHYYGAFPSGIETSPKVMYGTQNITNDCIYTITKSESIAGSWDVSTKTYTVTGLSSDTGWVDIQATYLDALTVTKRFDIVKLRSGADGEDAIVLQILSSNGNIFKNSTISTTLTVTIIVAGEIITSSKQMHEKFGENVFLQWEQKRFGQVNFEKIDPGDNRLSDEGFILTVDAQDIFTQTVFNCKLNF